MILKYKLWLEQEGKVFGKGPYQLLKGVEEVGSLSKSARKINMSYNKAHNLIRDIEIRLGFKLIEVQVGGIKGGGSVLTPEARVFMEKYEAFSNECEDVLDSIFKKYFY